ncbi:DUF86 domain-containing protein [Thalassospiraceae bacterium LMO-JJ14]|nr:DUF86 domain-containing protein [Thalassospiraceae bacterium LMO-JJ14]
MPHDPRAFLWDAQEAAQAIAAFTDGMTEAEYIANPLVRAAVERKFEIIGEALNRLSKTAPEIAARVPDLSAIVGFRNMLIHGYAMIENARVWRTVETTLPELRTAVTALLDELGPPER